MAIKRKHNWKCDAVWEGIWPLRILLADRIFRHVLKTYYMRFSEFSGSEFVTGPHSVTWRLLVLKASCFFPVCDEIWSENCISQLSRTFSKKCKPSQFLLGGGHLFCGGGQGRSGWGPQKGEPRILMEWVKGGRIDWQCPTCFVFVIWVFSLASGSTRLFSWYHCTPGNWSSSDLHARLNELPSWTYTGWADGS